MSEALPQLVCPRCRQSSTGRRCPRDNAFLVTRQALTEAPRDAYLGELVANRYAIMQRLGVGGMGSVYRARDEKTGKQVAIKFLLDQYANHPSIRTRFIREAEAALAVDNPHVVGLTDFGVDADSTLWLVMEYVKGWTLRDEVNNNGPFTIEQAVRLCRQMLRGLAAAHEAGLVHRDLKHDNIMFCGDRRSFVVRILDFGVVKSAVADADIARLSGPLTGAGVLVGSPSYMSPEQIRGLDVGPPADLYGLAVVLYEVLTARRLFSVNDYETLLRAGARRDAPPLYFTGSGEPVPSGFNRFIQRALALDPAERYPDANTMMLALDQMESSPDQPPDDLLADTPDRPAPLEEDDVVVRPLGENVPRQRSEHEAAPRRMPDRLEPEEKLLSEPSYATPEPIQKTPTPVIEAFRQNMPEAARDLGLPVPLWLPPLLAVVSAAAVFGLVSIF